MARPMFSLLGDRMINSRAAVVHSTNLVFLLFILVDQKIADAMIVQRPTDTTAMVNESTHFNCSTSIRPVNDRSVIWCHFPLDAGGDRKYVYDYGRILTNYRNRFDIDKNLSTGTFTLIALRLEASDAGRYECRDDVHADTGASAELTVLGSALVCDSDMDPDGVVGPTECHTPITPDKLRLSCSVTYNGRNVPQMVWRNIEDSSTINKTECVNKDNRMTCNTSLTADLQLNRSVYHCELTTTQKHNYCSLEIPNVLYVFSGNATVNITIDEEVKCSANSSQSCSYKWKWFNESNSMTVSINQTLKATRVGSHRCEATCDIGNKPCTIDVMFAEIYSTQSAEDTTGHARVLWPIGLAIAIVVMGIIIVVLYQKCKEHLPPILRFEWCDRNGSPSPEEIQDPSRGPLLRQREEGHINQDVIVRHLEFLEKHMDPDSGLLEELSAKETLSKQAIEEVRDKNPFHRRNSRLLDFILEKRQGPCLVEALRDTEQRHIVNYLNAKGEYRQEYGGEWPLTMMEISILYYKQRALIDELKLTDLPGRLYFAKVINKKQMTFISSKPTSSTQLDNLQRRSKVQALLDILKRRSIRDYRQTIICLRQSNQSNIAEMLETVSEGGADPGDMQIEMSSDPQFDNPPTKYDYYPGIVGEIKLKRSREQSE